VRRASGHVNACVRLSSGEIVRELEEEEETAGVRGAPKGGCQGCSKHLQAGVGMGEGEGPPELQAPNGRAAPGPPTPVGASGP